MSRRSLRRRRTYSRVLRLGWPSFAREAHGGCRGRSSASQWTDSDPDSETAPPWFLGTVPDTSIRQRSQKTDCRDAWQERIGAAPRVDESRHPPQLDRRARFEPHVEPAGAGLAGACYRVVGSREPRILQTDVQPVV